MIKKFLKKVMSFFEEKPEGIICPNCFGKGTVIVYRRPDRTPDPLDAIVQCPICRGTGYVPQYIRKEEKP